MLQRTFQHINGIGEKTERRLWASGIGDWQRFLKGPPRQSSIRINRLHTQWIAESVQALEDGDAVYFSRRLPSRLHWRFFPEFCDHTAYLDIETTGMDIAGGEITTVVLYDGRRIRHYINGKNLEKLPGDLSEYKVVVTYNGKSFDLPYIERFFGIQTHLAHIDLRYVLASLGYKGGLKACETALGIDRGVLRGVDGYFAVLLWFDYHNTGNEQALETLLAYNAEDVLNLEQLMIMAYNLKIRETPFAPDDLLVMPELPENPFSAHAPTLERMRRQYDEMLRE